LNGGVDDSFIQAHTAQINLADGTPIVVRPLRPSDRDRLIEAFERTSSHTRFLRFLRSVDRLSDKELGHLMDVDHRDRAAWVAVDPVTGDGLGIARYARDPLAPDTAEAAMAVVDDHQRKGIGHVLLRLLTETAISNGIKSFSAYVLGENRKVVEALSAAGATFIRDGTALKMEVAVPIDDTLFADSALVHTLRAAARGDLQPLPDPPVDFKA